MPYHYQLGTTANSFGSNHSGNGINFVRCDGSVEYIAAGVSDTVYRALCTIAGSEAGL